MLGPGTTLKDGEIKLLSRLGTGGFGEVFLAQTGDGLRAVKIVDTEKWSKSEYEVFNTMLMAEASFLSTLSHPVLPGFSELVAEGKRYYLVMEWVKGQDLEQYVQAHGPLSFAESHALIRDLLEGLHYFHRQCAGGVVFGDLKPANVMRVSENEFRLVDLGLASRFEHRLGGRFAIFSPNFSAPERIVGALSHPSQDIYSFGATIFYALTGHEPSPECSAQDLQRHLRRQADELEGALGEATLHCWKKFLTLLLACLDPEPEGRPRHVVALEEAWARTDAMLAEDAGASHPQAMDEIVRLLYKSKKS